MPTRYTSLATSGALTVGGALAGATIVLSGAFTGTTGVFSTSIDTPTLEAQTVSGTTLRDSAGTFTATAGVVDSDIIEARTVLSGATLHTQTGIILGDNDGAGCSTVYVLNGVVSAGVATCP